MKNTSILLVLSLVAIFFTNCTRDNYLDFQPKGVVIPNTYQHYRQLLDQVLPYEPFSVIPEGISKGFGATHSLTSFYNDDQDIVEDLLQDWGFPEEVVRAYTYQENFYTVLEEDPDWSNYYNQIYTVNVILEGLETATGTAEQLAQLRAEARLHRAFAYFNLVNLYCVHYNPATASTDLGVPIREGTQLDGLNLPRASVQETYDYILADILESYEDLKDFHEQKLRFRPSKAGAAGLLARVYLYQGKYELALEQADIALNYHSTLRDLSLEADLLTFPIGSENEQVIWFKYYDVEHPIFPSPELFRLYRPGDLRREWYVTYEWYFQKPIPRHVFGAIYFSDFYATVGISTEDMLLINAECNARLRNITAANASLNQLREKRFDPELFKPIFIRSAPELLSFVKEERRREMMHSMQRTFDVKRYNLFDDDGIRITHSLGGVTATIEPNSLNWAMPIASKYIQQNPEIIQNPRD